MMEGPGCAGVRKAQRILMIQSIEVFYLKKDLRPSRIEKRGGGETKTCPGHTFYKMDARGFDMGNYIGNQALNMD